jgi:hypothetical protein
MYLLSDVEDIALAPRRTITFWIEQGVLLPDPGTDRAGRGVHRQFSADEVIIACCLRAISQDHLPPIGRLLMVSKVLRKQLKSDGAGRKIINRAISGELNLFLVLDPDTISFFPVALPDSTPEPTIHGWKPVPVDAAFYNTVINPLITDNRRDKCLKTVVFLNPWLSQVREPLK